MIDSRNALIEKFRANLRTRVQKVRDMLEVLRQIPDNAEASSQVARELHTLKGEARLLGLVPLSDLTHLLEGVLGRVDAQSIATAEDGLEAMASALSDHIARDDADLLLANKIRDLQHPSLRPAPSELQPAVDSGKEESVAVDAAAPTGSNATRWVQVDAHHIDELCDGMAALSGDFGRVLAQLSRLAAASAESSDSTTFRRTGAQLLEECMRFRAALDSATVQTWGLRMVPAQPLLRELAAHARQLALAAGKNVEVSVDAAGVQIERDALDKVWDALIHLVRNSVDHGLEGAKDRGTKGTVGRLTISARTIGTSVVLAVADDGRGIDVDLVRRTAIARRLLSVGQTEKMTDDEVIQLVFERGFSTREKIGELSGRGVGLDVVKAQAESLGGRVDVHSRIGCGTRISIALPFTLTKERLMVFELAGGLFGLPAQSIHSLVGGRDLPQAADGTGRIIRIEDELVPLLSLAELLGREPEPCGAALVVTVRDQRYGLLVTKVVGARELIRRPAEPLLVRTTPIGASAMMEDGRAVLVLDLVKVGRQIRATGDDGDAVRSQRLEPNAVPRVLLVDDSPVMREMVSEILASAGLMVTTANDGEDALMRISEAEPDLVVSDIEMPRMDGFALLEQIRKRSQRLPVVMLTTRASVQDRQRATTLGANAYVLKEDFRSDVLLDVIQRFVPLHR